MSSLIPLGLLYLWTSSLRRDYEKEQEYVAITAKAKLKAYESDLLIQASKRSEEKV